MVETKRDQSFDSTALIPPLENQSPYKRIEAILDIWQGLLPHHRKQRIEALRPKCYFNHATEEE
jgi:hypothetical protein